jgi:phosphoribosyl 1,2-cyclic phosphate phosphodiesterase
MQASNAPSLTALFLGTGASLGVPLVGCKCETCTSQDKFNCRLRSSLLFNYNEKHILIDAGPDLRQQALTHKIYHLDGVILTHAHHDHTAGIDDLRIFYFRNKASIPCLLSQATAEDLKQRFYFMFQPQPHEVANAQRVALQPLEAEVGTIDFLGVPVRYFTYHQIGMPVLGIRVGNFAYVTDIKEYSEAIFEHLQGIDTLVVSAHRFTSSHMHFTVDEAIDFANRAKAKRTFLTHISHDLEHHKTNAYLPPNIRLAYDGLQITI